MMSFGDRILLAATVTDVHDGQYMYQACKVCYCKVSEPFSNPQRSICTKCKSSFTCEDTYFRYCLHFTAADNSCLANVTVFGSILNHFFGAEGSEFYFRHVLRLKQKFRHLGDVIVKTAIENIFVGQNLIFGFKVPKSFYSTKSKNQEILLKDICKVTIPLLQKNCTNTLPGLTAVQLLPQPNSVVTFTVIDVLKTLERRLEEMGYLEIEKITCELIKSLSRQNSAPLGSLHAVPSQDQQSCNLTSSIALHNSQTSLELSCDSSLNVSLNSTLLEPIGSPVVFNSEPKYTNKLKMSIDTESMHNNNSKCDADDGDITDSMRPTPSQNIALIQKYSVKKNVQKSLQKQIPKIESSGCKTQMKKSLLNEDKRNNSANEGSQVSKFSKKGNSSELSLSSSISSKPSEITCSVYKYNQENFSKVTHSKHGNVLCVVEPVNITQLSLKSKQKQMSSTCHSVCEISEVDIIRELSLNSDRIVSNDNSSKKWLSQDNVLKGSGNWIERTLQEEGVATPVEDQIFQIMFPSLDDQSNVDNNYMPESEDLELFLAAVNSEAAGDTGSQSLEETRCANSLSSQCVNETIEEYPHEHIVGSTDNIDKHSYKEFRTPNETNSKRELEEVGQDQSFTITEEHAAAISFNVTLRPSQKRQSGYHFSKSFRKTNDTSAEEQPESEDMWQFLERFPSTDSMNSPIYHNQPCHNTDHNLTRTLRLEDTHLMNLLNKPKAGTRNSILPPIWDCSQLNSLVIEKVKPDCKILQDEHPYSHSDSIRNNDSQKDLVLDSQFSQVSETLITSAISDKATFNLIMAQGKSKVDQDEHLSSLSADTNTHNSSIVDITLSSSSQDLFDYSFMFTSLENNGSLHKNKIASKHHSLASIENETAVIENISPTKDKVDLKNDHDQECNKKVRFSLVKREHFYWDFDLIKADAAQTEQRPLKSCLKLPTVPQNEYNVEFSTSQVDSEDLLSKEYISNNWSLSSSSPYNNSADLFSPSPIVSKAVKGTDTLNQTILTTNCMHCSVGILDYSLELFSQSQHCSTPIYMKNQCIKAEAHECVTPDLFD